MTEKQKNLIIRTITGILFVAVMVIGLLNWIAMIFLFAFITGMSIWEYSGLVNARKGVKVNRFISTLAGVYLFLSFAGLRTGIVNNFIVFIPYILTILYLMISELYLKHEDALNDWAYTMLGQLYLAFPFSLINILAFEKDPMGDLVHFNTLLPLSIFVFLWINDSCAYICGSLFGKHKLFPRISPGKTWEGSIGGGIITVIIAGIIGYFSHQLSVTAPQLSVLGWIGLGIVVVIFGTWGDLVESLLKRTLGIKDSGNILPGHGGILDRFDSAILAIPAAIIYLYTLELF
ncbi:MAG: phosphatidate cytidylyltransferase [Prevotella sp.]|jgi:phosphatidate cytidylyltransferase|nr:phosphatidate cytidylyltransferase [Prevotella sp.]MCH3985290.1 phosphatidate cytidylyltransferase [Prevotella sp.]MCH3992299.1 phosphatidate cytidylyltransferase [Prevotella sp.]MCH4215655.1 phosphatidate cytidylyltransferase [Prevotella sp.]MCI1291084.1 phosphatidate cytidylyltransferase [Prevotella sp.]